MRKFISSYSKAMLFSSILLTIVVLLGIYLVSLKMINNPICSYSFVVALVALSVLVITFIYAFVSQIEYIGVTEERFVIKKKLGQISFPRTDIISVRYKKSIMSDVRLFGISGLFGHIGLFWNSQVGRYHAFVNNGNSMLEIRTTKHNYVVSCNEFQSVLEILTSNISNSR